eukprot:CAMPEP_0182920758 /NCGR_PEP_ID=MMETSP0105_2-20130417/3701_1 /TAXON_ID=81532 ORGANISM="Acanthoeca-like sp., Strain 10tr" /NCGR_SAMPLE_ID=MMETSP0105_2 /ASSEMBLY_ACC=CAM_ASM_000205 /LENGTH=132 /DNA_ID=CAMNT_0025058209 /DNA_START=422 /DNA_END=821 /DNA_ORIENTATION=-
MKLVLLALGTLAVLSSAQQVSTSYGGECTSRDPSVEDVEECAASCVVACSARVGVSVDTCTGAFTQVDFLKYKKCECSDCSTLSSSFSQCDDTLCEQRDDTILIVVIVIAVAAASAVWLDACGAAASGAAAQ